MIAPAEADLTTTDDTASDFDNQYVSFWIDGQLLGVPVRVVQEVLNSQEIARTPRARPEIAGLLNLRGQIVTAVDLRKRLSLPERDGDSEPMNVVVRQGGESFSLLVDAVGDVIDVGGQQPDAPPPTLDAQWKDVTSGVYRLEDRLVVVVSVEAILDLSA